MNSRAHLQDGLLSGKESHHGHKANPFHSDNLWSAGYWIGWNPLNDSRIALGCRAHLLPLVTICCRESTGPANLCLRPPVCLRLSVSGLSVCLSVRPSASLFLLAYLHVGRLGRRRSTPQSSLYRVRSHKKSVLIVRAAPGPSSVVRLCLRLGCPASYPYNGRRRGIYVARAVHHLAVALRLPVLVGVRRGVRAADHIALHPARYLTLRGGF